MLAVWTEVMLCAEISLAQTQTTLAATSCRSATRLVARCTARA
jgi:hypothetical protein